MTNQYTLPLSAVQAELAAVGGKGASLARLVRAGLPVPDGFHVTTAAYRAFVDENALQPRILEALQAVDTGQPATLESASAQIGTLFAAAHIPTGVVAAVEAAYAALANSQLVTRNFPSPCVPPPPPKTCPISHLPGNRRLSSM